MASLRMVHELEELPRPDVPLYHELFSWEGDEEPLPGKWLQAVASAFGADFVKDKKLTEAVFRERYLSDPRFDRAGFFFVMSRGDTAGTAFAWCDEDDPSLGQLHWLTVPPAHQRIGIGRCLALLVLHHHKSLGRKRVFLRTEP